MNIWHTDVVKRKLKKKEAANLRGDCAKKDEWIWKRNKIKRIATMQNNFRMSIREEKSEYISSDSKWMIYHTRHKSMVHHMHKEPIDSMCRSCFGLFFFHPLSGKVYVVCGSNKTDIHWVACKSDHFCVVFARYRLRKKRERLIASLCEGA